MVGFHYLSSRPDQQPNAWKWGVLCDVMTLCLVLAYVLMISYGVDINVRFSYTSYVEDRMYCGVTPRVAVPIFTLYLYALSAGRGITCRLLSAKSVVSLSKASYAIYLFHQPVFEWWSYFIDGEFWTQRKRFEWFSPDPIMLSGAETAVVMLLTVLFAIAANHIVDNHLMSGWLKFFRYITCRARQQKSNDGEKSRSYDSIVLEAVEDIVGLQPSLTDHLADLLASLGVASLCGALESRDKRARLSPVDILQCETVADLVAAVSAKIEEGSGSGAKNSTSSSPFHVRLWKWLAGFYVTFEDGEQPASVPLPPSGRSRRSTMVADSEKDFAGDEESGQTTSIRIDAAVEFVSQHSKSTQFG